MRLIKERYYALGGDRSFSSSPSKSNVGKNGTIFASPDPSLVIKVNQK